MPAKNTIKVLIGGKIITLSGYESEEYLQSVASYMNHKLPSFPNCRDITDSRWKQKTHCSA